MNRNPVTINRSIFRTPRGNASTTLRNFLTAGTALAGLSLAGAPAFAAVVTWDGGGGNLNWGTANNWSANALPGPADDVVIDGAVANTPVVLNVGSTIKTLTIDAGDSLSMNNGKNLTLNGGGNALTNNGTLAINAGASNTVLTIQNDTTVGGSGVMNLNDDIQNFIQTNGATITNAAGHTIQGSGQLLNNTGGMVNEGTIKATGSAAALVIDPNNTKVFVNKGILQAVGTAGLTFDGGAYTNTGKSIDVLNGSRLDLNSGSTITNGTLTTAGSGVINTNAGAVLSGVTLAGNAVQGDGQNVTIQNGLTNNGTWAINAGLSNTLLTIQGDTVLGGTGVMNLNDDIQNFILSNNATITHAAGHTIQGSGRLLNNGGGMVNEGAIKATGSLAALVIDPNAKGFVNKGTLQAVGTAGLTFDAGAYTNTGNSIDVLNGSRLDLNSGATVANGTLTTAGSGVINTNAGAVLSGVTLAGNAVQGDGQNVTIQNGLTNNGTWAINAGGGNTLLTIQGDTVLGGTGVMNLTDDIQNFILSNNATITHAVGHTIQGSGRLLNNGGGMVNEGTIKATGSAAALVIDPNTKGFVNKGTLQAAGKAGLTFDGGAYTNTGKSIDVLNGSRLDLNSGANVTNGTLTTAGSGVINTNAGAVLSGVTLAGNAVQGDGQNVTIQNGLTNNGTWAINAGGGSTLLTIQGDTVLGGTGVMNLTDDIQNFILSNNATITHAVGHTIQGSGRLLNNGGGMVNEGAIKATGSLAALVIDPNTKGFVNKGLLRAEGKQGIDLVDGANTRNSSGNVEVGGGSRIDVTGNYLQTGGATVVEDGGLLTATGTVNIQGGRLGGNGTVDANVNNSGGVTGAGMSVGMLTIDGKYMQSGLGAFEQEIDSLTSFDFVQVLGTATLDGLLDVIVDSLFAPSLTIGATFEILNATSITGNFATLSDNFSELTFEHFIAAGSTSGSSVYLRVTNVNFPPPSDVPEPEAVLLFGSGLAALTRFRRKLRRAG